MRLPVKGLSGTEFGALRRNKDRRPKLKMKNRKIEPTQPGPGLVNPGRT